MTEKTYQVGDVVPWRKVQPGSLVRQGAGDYALRIGDQHHWVRLTNTIQMDWARVGACGGWLFDDGEEIDEGPVTIVALDVPADAAAEQLRELAEVFEVREALTPVMAHDCEALRHGIGQLSRSERATPALVRDALADRLYRAGWRPDMTAEDAARLLAGGEREPECSRCRQTFAWNDEADHHDDGPLFCNTCAHEAAARMLAEQEAACRQ